MKQQLIRKLVNVDVKELEDRVLEFIGSNEAMDRDGEVISSSGWDLKAFKKNPVFLWAHDYRQPPIGKAIRVGAEDGSLKFQIKFADRETYEFADTIYRLYKGGFLHATSVGFIPQEWVDGKESEGPRRTYKKQELLELSAVPVPSNPEALSLAVGKGVITGAELEAITKTETSYDDNDGPMPITTSSNTANWLRVVDVNFPWPDSGTVALSWPDITQKSLKDELDYARHLIREADMDEEAAGIMKGIAEDIIMRLPGSEIPVDILGKVGAVLSGKNKGNLKQAQELIQTVLDSAEPPQENYEPGEVARLVVETIRNKWR